MSSSNDQALSGAIFEESALLTVKDLSRMCAVDERHIVEFVEEGVLTVVEINATEWYFTGAALRRARLALRLQGDTRKTALEFRKHFGWYTKGVAGAAGLRERLFQIESMQQAEAIFAAYLAGSAVEQAA